MKKKKKKNSDKNKLPHGKHEITEKSVPLYQDIFLLCFCTENLKFISRQFKRNLTLFAGNSSEVVKFVSPDAAHSLCKPGTSGSLFICGTERDGVFMLKTVLPGNGLSHQKACRRTYSNKNTQINLP